MMDGERWARGKTHQQRPKLTALLRAIYRFPSGNSTNVVQGLGALDAGDQMDGSLRPTNRFHRFRDRFQILHGVNFGQYERPNRGNGELRGKMSESRSECLKGRDKCGAYNADDVVLEERGVGAIYADSDARCMGQFIGWRFLHGRSVTVVG